MVMPKGQKARVLAYLRLHGSITDADARSELGISRLAAVIFRLKDDEKIVMQMEKGVNKFGEKVRYARYFLKA